MHAVRTPVFGIGFAFVLLLLETLGARAYIADRTTQVEEVQRRSLADHATVCGGPKVCLDHALAKGCD